MWKYSTAKSNLGAPKLESLPATDEYFFQNLKRSHLQIAVERRSLNADPRTVDICFYRCVKKDETKYLIPLPVAPDVCLVPEELTKVFRSGCVSENSPKSRSCSCSKPHLTCTMFCEC